ncbi:hypothetical protein E8L99_21675 [Phreatobacter aquaticus]|uniref:Glycosyltransferase RgtA/B/C/D-like domain-containing protein n=1 Tax=Phreatobacter aquaticus TaxID=2570229 RepID=A0A4D7QLU8_9HYPH|nr:hypothetical protein [Phreatobacter aquaticus]QCK88185.1 hypothetical protein E8L99_21675 [Phreatobacter aquaticus]
MIGLTIFSFLYWMAYVPHQNLHDGAHYVVSGVSLVRDQANINYPYHPHRWGNAYEFWQAGTAKFDVRVSYPSQLYGAMLGFYSLLAGGLAMSSVTMNALVNCALGNILTYLVLRRYASGMTLLFSVVATATLALMVVILAPGNNGVGYAAALFVLWLIICTRAHPALIGLVLGASCHLRSQLLSLAPLLPFIIVAVNPRRRLPPVLGWIGLGTGASYFGFSILFALLVGGSSNAMQFYTDHFSSSLLGKQGLNEFLIVANKFIQAMIRLFASDQMFLFAPLMFGLLILSRSRLARTLAGTSIAFVMMSVVLYSFDRFAPPQPRYFIVAVPMIALAGVISLRDYVVITGSRVSAAVAAGFFAALTTGTLYTHHGFAGHRLSIADVWQRATYLDFPGAAETLTHTFGPDDVVIVNHSLPTGLRYLPKVIYVPPYEQFLAGDNSNIAGMAFVFGDNVPDDFFKPRDWMPSNNLPETFVDKRGTVFRRVYARSNVLQTPGGIAASRVHMAIYQRVTP